MPLDIPLGRKGVSDPMTLIRRAWRYVIDRPLV